MEEPCDTSSSPVGPVTFMSPLAVSVSSPAVTIGDVEVRLTGEGCVGVELHVVVPVVAGGDDRGATRSGGGSCLW